MRDELVHSLMSELSFTKAAPFPQRLFSEFWILLVISIGAICNPNTAIANPMMDCEQDFSFTQPSDSLSLQTRPSLKLYQRIDSVSFGGSPTWYVTNQWDLNGDGQLESVISYGNPGDYGEESAILSPCGDSGFTVILGPVYTQGWFPLTVEPEKSLEVLTREKIAWMSGWQSLQQKDWIKWIPILEWAPEPRSGDGGEKGCEDFLLIRSDFKAGRYQPSYVVNCSCLSAKCDSGRPWR